MLHASPHTHRQTINHDTATRREKFFETEVALLNIITPSTVTFTEKRPLCGM
jgi:hypothetical protein